MDPKGFRAPEPDPGPHRVDQAPARAVVSGRLQTVREATGEPPDDRAPGSRGRQRPFSTLRLSAPMRFPSRRRFLHVARHLLAAGLLLAGCSPPDPSPPPAAGAVAPPDIRPSRFPYGVWADYYNGFDRHIFGDPLRDFPQMRPLPHAPGEVRQGYVFARATAWFGAHRAQVRGPYGYFFDDQFYRLRAVADAAVLRPEAIELFGPGQAQGPHRLVWEGYRARAVYTETPTPGGFEGQLDLVNKYLEDTLAARPRAQLQTTTPPSGADKRPLTLVSTHYPATP